MKQQPTTNQAQQFLQISDTALAKYPSQGMPYAQISERTYRYDVSVAPAPRKNNGCHISGAGNEKSIYLQAAVSQ